MTELLSAATILSGLAVVPSLAQARAHHHLYPYWLPYVISYNYNCGPGELPGTFAYYDGPSTDACAQGSATYIGQDRRRHPCFDRSCWLIRPTAILCRSYTLRRATAPRVGPAAGCCTNQTKSGNRAPGMRS